MGRKKLFRITKLPDRVEYYRETTRVIRLRDFEVDFWYLWGLLEGLEDTDPVSRVIIYDRKLAKFLEELEVVFRSVKGSYYRGKRFKELYDIIANMVNREEVESDRTEEIRIFGVYEIIEDPD